MTDTTQKIDPVASKKSPELARKNLQAVLFKIQDLGVTRRSLRFLQIYFQLRPIKLTFGKRNSCLTILLLWILYCLARNSLMATRYTRCLFEFPSFTQKIFRPAEDCSVCLDVKEVEKLSGVDPAFFEERYAYSGRPVVITDATSNWTAPQVFSFSFFKDLYEGQVSNCQFFPYKTEFHSLQEVLNMSRSRAQLEAGTKSWYVGWSNCDERTGNVLREHYDRPYFLPATAESEKTDWIFMGSPGYGAPMHVDDVEHPSWQAQLRGRKLWILEPPRECHYVCNRLEVYVNPGEIIILDTNRWYHQTLIVSEDMSITIGAEYD
ncbi:uncharacterized protein LOC107269546 [Cephus cinctus]|uniref:Uncharacterized protein LOC107269546 n=1 Tax=Cephus cinctus TaxID=211228 RepID=A0AAJ7C0N6_CEPCN|nr:uncharacterized protein LOC107269546 [Cephus cinctus]